MQVAQIQRQSRTPTHKNTNNLIINTLIKPAYIWCPHQWECLFGAILTCLSVVDKLTRNAFHEMGLLRWQEVKFCPRCFLIIPPPIAFIQYVKNLHNFTWTYEWDHRGQAKDHQMKKIYSSREKFDLIWYESTSSKLLSNDANEA